MRRPEEALHRACVELLAVYQQRGLLAYCHVANGGHRTKTEAGVLKAMGLVAGVPDILVWTPNGRAFQVELKAPGGRGLSDPQLCWHALMATMGHAVYVCRSVDDLEHVLRCEHVPPVGKLDARIAPEAAQAVQECDEPPGVGYAAPRPKTSRPATDFRSPR